MFPFSIDNLFRSLNFNERSKTNAQKWQKYNWLAPECNVMCLVFVTRGAIYVISEVARLLGRSCWVNNKRLTDL